MRQSGFDGLVKSALARDEIVYSGFSAAAVIAFDSTRVDPPLQVEPSRIELVDREIAFYEANGIPYRTLPAWPIWLLLQRGPCCNGACARIPAIRLARQRLRGDCHWLSPFRRRERGSPLRRPAQHPARSLAPDYQRQACRGRPTRAPSSRDLGGRNRTYRFGGGIAKTSMTRRPQRQWAGWMPN